LRNVLHVGGVSISGLAQILSRIAAAPEIAEETAYSLQSAILDLFSRLRKVSKLPLRGGGELEWEVLDFSKTLPALLRESAELRNLYAAAVARSRPSAAQPWSAAVAFDEFCPGNKLQAAVDLPRAY
jgi:hypothetical protein